MSTAIPESFYPYKLLMNSMANNYEDFGMIDQLADDGPLYIPHG